MAPPTYHRGDREVLKIKRRLKRQNFAFVTIRLQVRTVCASGAGRLLGILLTGVLIANLYICKFSVLPIADPLERKPYQAGANCAKPRDNLRP